MKTALASIQHALDEGRELLSWLSTNRYGAFLGQVERKAKYFASEHLGTLLHAAQAATYQARVSTWAESCFGATHYDMTQRGDRLLKEVLELLQSKGYDGARVAPLVDYVFGRPAGEPAQEVGGVMVTLSTFCTVANIDMLAAGEAELARINEPAVMARIRAKHAAKNALQGDSPLPGTAGAEQQASSAPAPFLRALYDALEGSRHHSFYQLKQGRISPNEARRQRIRDDRIREVAEQLVQYVRDADCECPSERCPSLASPCPRCKLLERATGEAAHG